MKLSSFVFTYTDMEQQDNNNTVLERSALKQDIEDLQQMVSKKTTLTKKSKKSIEARMLPISQLQLAILKLEKQASLSGKEANKLKANHKALNKQIGYNKSDTNNNIARHKHLEDNKLALRMMLGQMTAYNVLLEGEAPPCEIDTDDQAMAKYDEMAKHNKESDEQVGKEEDMGEKPGNDNMEGIPGEGNAINAVVEDNESSQSGQASQASQASQSGQSGQSYQGGVQVKSEMVG